MAKQYTTAILPPELIRFGEADNDSVSSFLPINKKGQDALVQMRAKLWDAYRLAYIVLGEGSIRGEFDLENGTLLRAIRAVAETREELSHLNKCLDLCYKREKRHRQNFESKEVLRDKCQTSEYQLAQQRLEYQALQATHQEYVQDTKGQLQDLHLLQSRSRTRGSAIDCPQEEEEEDPQESQAYQQLFVRVAKASALPQIQSLQAELKASREDTKRAQQQSLSQKEEMEYVTHVEKLSTALNRAACQQQGTCCSNLSGGVASVEIKDISSKLQSMSPTTATSEERQEMQSTILELLERLAANNPTRETVHDLELKLAAAGIKERDRDAQLKDLLSELKVVEGEKEEVQKELQTTEVWYQEKLFASMEQEKDQQAEIYQLDAQLDELAEEAVHVEEKYEIEREKSRLREQASSKKVMELEAQLKQVMEDQQRSLLLMSATAPAADKNAQESTEAIPITPPQNMKEAWNFPPPPCLSPADTDSASAHDLSSSGYSYNDDDCMC
jgi:hypothetical protein